MSTRRWLFGIILLAVLARAGFLLLFGDTLSLQTSGYDAYAVNVIEGRGYTRFDDRNGDSDLPPLYPFFLVGVYKTLGRDPLAVAAVQIVLDVGVMGLLFWLGRRVSGQDGVGLLAAALYGFYPYLLYQNLTVNDTGLFIFLLTAGVAAAYRARDTRAWGWAAVLGASFGLAALTKTWALLIWPLLVWWWVRKVGWRAAARLALASGALIVLTTAPWAVRNTRLQGEFVYLSTNGGSNLHQGNNPCAADYLAHGWDVQWIRADCMGAPPPDLSETEADRWHRQAALDYLRAHPEQWPRLFGIKFWVLWSPAITPYGLPPNPYLIDDAVLQFYESRSFQLARVVHVLYFTPLLVLGVVGWVLAARRKLEIAPLVAVFAAITFTYLLFHPSTRYRAPADPFVFVLAAYALARGWAWWRARTEHAA